MFHLSTLRNQSFNFFILPGICWSKTKQRSALCSKVLLLYLYVFDYVFHFDCKDMVWKEALIHVYFCTQLTKLLNLIALLGINYSVLW